MKAGINTGHTDKSGRPVHFGDVIELRMGMNSKHGGPQRLRIIKVGKDKMHAIYSHAGTGDTQSSPVPSWMFAVSVVVDCDHFPSR